MSNAFSQMIQLPGPPMTAGESAVAASAEKPAEGTVRAMPSAFQTLVVEATGQETVQAGSEESAVTAPAEAGSAGVTASFAALTSAAAATATVIAPGVTAEGAEALPAAESPEIASPGAGLATVPQGGAADFGGRDVPVTSVKAGASDDGAATTAAAARRGQAGLDATPGGASLAEPGKITRSIVVRAPTTRSAEPARGGTAKPDEAAPDTGSDTPVSGNSNLVASPVVDLPMAVIPQAVPMARQASGATLGDGGALSGNPAGAPAVPDAGETPPPLAGDDGENGATKGATGGRADQTVPGPGLTPQAAIGRGKSSPASAPALSTLGAIRGGFSLKAASPGATTPTVATLSVATRADATRADGAAAAPSSLQGTASPVDTGALPPEVAAIPVSTPSEGPVAGVVPPPSANTEPGPVAAEAPVVPASTLSQTAVDTLTSLSIDIHKRLSDGSTKFALELKPADLGRVDVALTIAADGKVSAHLDFDTPITASSFAARESELRQHLAAAGLSLGGDGLTFSSRAPEVAATERGGGGGQQGSGQPGSGQSGSGQAGSGQAGSGQAGSGQAPGNSTLADAQMSQQQGGQQARQNGSSAQRQAARALKAAEAAATQTDLDTALNSLRYRSGPSRLALDLTV